MKPDLDILSMACAEMKQQMMRHFWVSRRMNGHPHLKKTAESLLIEWGYIQDAHNNLFSYGVKYFQDEWGKAVYNKTQLLKRKNK